MKIQKRKIMKIEPVEYTNLKGKIKYYLKLTELNIIITISISKKQYQTIQEMIRPKIEKLIK